MWSPSWSLILLNPNQISDGIPRSVIAVTDLGGHAYESWTNPDTLQMWLHDFLPSSFKNVRIMTYGYDSKLAGEPRTQNTLLDYRRHFVTTLKNVRATEASVSTTLYFQVDLLIEWFNRKIAQSSS